MNNTEKTLEKHTKEVIIEQIDICLSGQDPRYQLGRYIEKLKEEIIQQALAEDRERVRGEIKEANGKRPIHTGDFAGTESSCNCKWHKIDDLLSLDKPLTDK